MGDRAGETGNEFWKPGYAGSTTGNLPALGLVLKTECVVWSIATPGVLCMSPQQAEIRTLGRHKLIGVLISGGSWGETDRSFDFWGVLGGTRLRVLYDFSMCVTKDLNYADPV
jgi:hypothetical protein